MTDEKFDKFSTNIIYCYLDLKFGEEKAGRVVIELYKAIVPKTVENFRSLCTGEKGNGIQGKPLHYKGTTFNRVVPQFMVQAGDIINDNGTGGESIYGLTFNDENFVIKHESEGMVGMANNGENTNSSQFYITTFACSHLDGRNVAFGKVVKGLNIIKEMDCFQRENDKSIVKCVIMDCGEFKPGESWNYWENDKTEDVYPPWPDDWEYEKDNIKQDIENVITKIKNSGNFYFKQNNLIDSDRKYKKALRYINWYMFKNNECKLDKINAMKVKSLMNLATVRLKRHKYVEVISLCTQAIEIDPKNSKAYFKRAQASMALRDYDSALTNFKTALNINPNNKLIYTEFQQARNTKLSYMAKEKEVANKELLFRNISNVDTTSYLQRL